MKRALLAACCLAAVASAFAATPDTTGPEWKPLFKPDYADADKPAGVWSVVDGLLTASADQCLWTKDEHENFMLDLEF